MESKTNIKPVIILNKKEIRDVLDEANILMNKIGSVIEFFFVVITPDNKISFANMLHKYFVINGFYKLIKVHPAVGLEIVKTIIDIILKDKILKIKILDYNDYVTEIVVTKYKELLKE